MWHFVQSQFIPPRLKGEVVFFLSGVVSSLAKGAQRVDTRETPAIQIQLEVSRGPKVYLHVLIIDHLAESEPSYSTSCWVNLVSAACLP